MRNFIAIAESSLLGLESLIQSHDDVDQFIKSLDGSYADVLYRGGGPASNGSFMTDTLSHAAEYADGDYSQVYAYMADFSTVLRLQEQHWAHLRTKFSSWKEPEVDEYGFVVDHDANDDDMYFSTSSDEYNEFVAYYTKLGGDWNGFYDTDEAFQVIAQNASLRDVQSDHDLMNPMIPIFLDIAAKQGYNFIAFMGGDYDGDQIEFVVVDASKLIDLRAEHAKYHGGIQK